MVRGARYSKARRGNRKSGGEKQRKLCPVQREVRRCQQTETAAPVAGLTQHSAYSAPPESSLLQGHLFPKQEVELGETFVDMRTNMGAGHTAGLGGR